jgi:hypothetical protein
VNIVARARTHPLVPPEARKSARPGCGDAQVCERAGKYFETGVTDMYQRSGLTGASLETVTSEIARRSSGEFPQITLMNFTRPTTTFGAWPTRPVSPSLAKFASETPRIDSQRSGLTGASLATVASENQKCLKHRCAHFKRLK